MSRDYAVSRGSWRRSLKALLSRDYRTSASIRASQRIFDGLGPAALCLAPGGGPVRFHSALVNLNIAPFENVDVVADAHRLPYRDATVDAMHSEAVFEHLSGPARAAAEMYRVMRPGAMAFVATPFLAQYHGYPHHYQNYTMQGHQQLFADAGFEIVEAGHCVGPVVAITTLMSAFCRGFLPYPFNRLGWAAVAGLSVLVRPIDRLLEHKANAHVLAATTYALIRKPARATAPQSP